MYGERIPNELFAEDRQAIQGFIGNARYHDIGQEQNTQFGTPGHSAE